MAITLFEGFHVASTFEKFALIGVLVIAIIGLLYAAFLTRQILREPEGNEKMKHVADAIRSGGNAYLMRQFRTIIWLVFILIYLPAIGLEEQHLAGLFPGFGQYAALVPMLWPRLRPMPAQGRFTWRLYLHNREYQALAGFLVGVLVLIWKAWR